MNKQLKCIIAIVILIIGLLAFSKSIFEKFRNTDTIVNKIGSRLFEFNSININLSNQLSMQDITLKIEDRLIFQDGKQKSKIGTEYGHVILDIYHKGLLIAQIGHFKTNNWYSYDYELKLQRIENNIHVNQNIIGPDSSNDSFQKRYIYSRSNVLMRIEYLSENGKIYKTDEKMQRF